MSLPESPILDQKPSTHWLLIPLLGFDLFIVQLPLFLLTVIQYASGSKLIPYHVLFDRLQPQTLANDFVYLNLGLVIVSSVALWVTYTLIFALLIGRTVSLLILRLSLVPETTSPLKRCLFFLFNPFLITRRLLKIEFRKQGAYTITQRILIGVFIVFYLVINPLLFGGSLYFLAAHTLHFYSQAFTKEDAQDVKALEEKANAFNRGTGKATDTDGLFLSIVNSDESCPVDLVNTQSRTVLVVNPNIGSGSGVVLSKHYILTNYHVVEGNHEGLTVYDEFGTHYNTRLFKYDYNTDIALLKGDFMEVEPPEFLMPESMTQGKTELYAVGYPGSGLGDYEVIRDGTTQSATYGHFSSLVQSGFYAELTFVKTDAAINHGNSGGPLVNRCNQIAGINSYRGEGDNQGYAISSGYLVKRVNELLELSPANLSKKQTRTGRVTCDSQSTFSDLSEALAHSSLVCRLVLVNQDLTELPTQIGEMVNLQELNVANNQLTTLPAEIAGLPKIRIVTLTGNPIDDTEKEKIRYWLQGAFISF